MRLVLMAVIGLVMVGWLTWQLLGWRSRRRTEEHCALIRIRDYPNLDRATLNDMLRDHILNWSDRRFGPLLARLVRRHQVIEDGRMLHITDVGKQAIRRRPAYARFRD